MSTSIKAGERMGTLSLADSIKLKISEQPVRAPQRNRSVRILDRVVINRISPAIQITHQRGPTSERISMAHTVPLLSGTRVHVSSARRARRRAPVSPRSGAASVTPAHVYRLPLDLIELADAFQRLCSARLLFAARNSKNLRRICKHARSVTAPAANKVLQPAKPPIVSAPLWFSRNCYACLLARLI